MNENGFFCIILDILLFYIYMYICICEDKGLFRKYKNLF